MGVGVGRVSVGRGSRVCHHLNQSMVPLRFSQFFDWLRQIADATIPLKNCSHCTKANSYNGRHGTWAPRGYLPCTIAQSYTAKDHNAAADCRYRNSNAVRLKLICADDECLGQAVRLIKTDNSDFFFQRKTFKVCHHDVKPIHSHRFPRELSAVGNTRSEITEIL